MMEQQTSKQTSKSKDSWSSMKPAADSFVMVLSRNI